MERLSFKSAMELIKRELSSVKDKLTKAEIAHIENSDKWESGELGRSISHAEKVRLSSKDYDALYNSGLGRKDGLK